MVKLYDINYKTDGRLVVEKLVEQDGMKKLQVENPPFKPYCYVKEEDFNPRHLRNKDVVVGNDAPDGYIKIEADHPAVIRDFKNDKRLETFEADVDFGARCLIDTALTIDVPDREDILYFDIEVDPSDGFPDPDLAKDRILSIGAVGGDGEEFYFDGKDERQMVIDFLRAADDYFVLAGWNSIGFDFPYLENRSRSLGIDPKWQRWVRLDMMPLYDSLAVPTKTVSLKLADVGQDELDATKTEDIGTDPTVIKDWWVEGDERLKIYNMQDCHLLKDLDEKYDVIRLLHEVCGLCNYPPGQACYESKHGKVRLAVGMIADAKVLSTAKKRGVPLNNRGKHADTGEFPGGDVLKPKPGLYENVVTMDYSGMYPNIIRAFNFGPETWYPNDAELLYEHPEAKVIEGESGVFVDPDTKKSILAEAVDELVGMRERFKDAIQAAPADSVEKKTAERRDSGVKVVNNTLYGIFASPYHRYYIPGGSENITLIGQKLVRKVEGIAEQSTVIDFVIYGDTDSVMVKLKDTDDVITTAQEAAAKIEQELQSWASNEKNAVGKYLELDVDNVFARFFISDKKKRYFGNVIFDGKPCDSFKVKGFEVRQGDWPDSVRKFQEELMHAVIDGNPTQPIIQETRKKLFNGLWDFDMGTQTTLTKPISEYDTPLPHTRAAEQIQDEFGSTAARPDDKIGYVKYGRNKTDVTYIHNGKIGRNFRPNEGYCHECETVKSNDHGHETETYPHFRSSHYSHLWQKKFRSVMNSIEVDEFNQSALGDFA